MFAKEGLDQIPYPVTHEQISAIEDKLTLCINLHDEGKARTPVYISTKLYPNTLLYWEPGVTDGSNNDGH